MHYLSHYFLHSKIHYYYYYHYYHTTTTTTTTTKIHDLDNLSILRYTFDVLKLP